VNRVVITGIGCVGSQGVGAEALAAALREGLSLGRSESIEKVKAGRREMSIARIAPFDREKYLPARKLRRMGELSQIWVVSCILAGADAGLDGAGSGGPYPPEKRGTYLGTGLGCIDITWEYLVGMYRDGAGMANPFFFSESVANAPAGHSAIELGTRGGNITFTCGDASAAAAIEFGARAIRDGRVEIAYCGGIETLNDPTLRVLAGIGSPLFVGEGAACLVLESLASARSRSARIYAELAGSAAASDPSATATDWGRDPAPLKTAMRRAVERSASEVRKVFLHAPTATRAASAELEAALHVCPGAAIARVSDVVGALSGAGGFNPAAAALDVAAHGGAVLVNATSWGGGIFSLVMRGVTGRPAV
jgi:3-oxoacyl-[acyl-carrier-protein] synthase II